jgi:integration host factor subunit alpha
MIKADIIDLVHEKVGFSRHESSEVVEATLDVLKEALQKGERVQIVGFGSFLVRPKKERVGAILKLVKKSRLPRARS